MDTNFHESNQANFVSRKKAQKAQRKNGKSGKQEFQEGIQIHLLPEIPVFLIRISSFV
jgi:hypothetical protein